MDNLNNNLYDKENWVSLSEPVVSKGDALASEEVIPVKRNSRVNFSPVLTFQLVVCLAFVAMLFICKTFFSNTFSYLFNAYNEAVNTSMYFDGDLSSLDFSPIFSASNDEF